MKVKKIGSLLLALVMCFSLMSVAWAAGDDGGKITIEESTSGYTYIAYQIFSGTYSIDENETETLANIDWGTGIYKTALAATDVVNAINTLFGFTEEDALTEESIVTQEGAQQIAAALTDDNVKAFASIINGCVTGGTELTYTENAWQDDDDNYQYGYVIDNLGDGYYLIENTTVPEIEGAWTDYILQIVGGEDISMEPKEDVPESHKYVDDINDSTGDSATADQKNKSADYDIGDMVKFTLEADLPQNYADYTTYTLIFHDKMTTGLTFDANGADFHFYVDGEEVTLTAGTASYNDETGTWSVSNGQYAIVTAEEYNNALGLTGEDADTCTFHIVFADLKSAIPSIEYGKDLTVTFLAKLNENAVIGNYGETNESYIDFSNDVNNASHMDKTPTEKVGVFTYRVIVNKVDQEGTPLTGASFSMEKLYKDNNSNVENITLGGVSYSGTFVAESNATTSEKEGVEDCVFTWTGIDDGVYKITETNTPDGYNPCDPIYIVVTAVHEADDTATGYSTTLNVTAYDKDGNELKDANDNNVFYVDNTATSANIGTNGTIVGTIMNQKGSSLPSTGGIGTTIFYIIGGVLVVGAAVVLIARRRVNSGDAE